MWLHFPPLLRLLPLPSIPYQAEKHSQELFKQNANGLQMDLCFL